MSARLSNVAAVALAALLTLSAAAQERRPERRAKDRAPEPEAAAAAAPQDKPAEPGPQPAQPPQRPRRSGPGLLMAVTVYSVDLDGGRLAELDARSLAAGAETPAALLKVLEGFGAARVLYRVDQVVAIGMGGRAEVARDLPYVTGTSTTATGQVTTSIARERVGAKVTIEDLQLDPGESAHAGYASIMVELGDLTASAIGVGEKVTAPVFWRIMQTHNGEFQLQRPIVLLNVAGTPPSGADTAQAFVTLITFRPPI
jgi:hypothetical protein